jgi:phosphoenolpyruvate synthase/pyruvate phosphate dikinase
MAGRAFAELLAAGPTVAIGHAKRLMHEAPGRSFADQLAAESEAGRACAATEDHREALRAAAERVHASGANERARAYGLGGSVAVIIQREVAATRAGVAFSRDPVGRSNDVVIECGFGHGEAVVSGETTPDRFNVREDGGVAARIAARSGRRAAIRTLRDDEARVVAGLARRAEDGFGVPVDVEFCYERRRLWLVQCRPITTL